MTSENMEQRLVILRESLVRLKALHAWADLRLSEVRPGDSPEFLGSSEIAYELRSEQSHFLSTRLLILERLNEPDKHGLDVRRCDVWRREVLELQAEFDRLVRGKRL